MNATSYSSGRGWGAWLGIGIALVLVGAVAATWVLAHYAPAARLLGVAPIVQQTSAQRVFVTPPQPQTAAPLASQSADAQRISGLEQRLARVENATEQVQGSAGRADALVVTFAARRAIDRGVALGYLEPLLTGRFGPDHEQAVATVITAAHQPIRLSDLITEYEALGPQLRSGGPAEGWWANLKHEFGTLIEVRALFPGGRNAVGRRCRQCARRDHAAARRSERCRLDFEGTALCRRSSRAG
jgi:hypothetical protein